MLNCLSDKDRLPAETAVKKRGMRIGRLNDWHFQSGYFTASQLLLFGLWERRII